MHINDIHSMTQAQFDALSDEEKSELAREFAYKVLFETPLDKQKLVFTTVECMEYFGEEFENEFYSVPKDDVRSLTQVIEGWSVRLKYIKSILDIESVFDSVLDAREEYESAPDEDSPEDIEDWD